MDDFSSFLDPLGSGDPVSDPLPAFDARADLSSLLFELGRLAGVTPAEFAFTHEEDASRWTVGQHLEHILRADELNLRAIEKIRDGRDDGPDPPLSGSAARILVEGWIPRGVAQAPAPVVPPDHTDETRIEELRQVQIHRWRALEEEADTIGGWVGRIAHPLLGSFRAVDWLRFAAIHTAHHREIVEEILGRR